MPKNLKRVVVYLPDDQHRRLKSRLALLGISVSEWARREIMKFIGEE